MTTKEGTEAWRHLLYFPRSRTAGTKSQVRCQAECLCSSTRVCSQRRFHRRQAHRPQTGRALPESRETEGFCRPHCKPEVSHPRDTKATEQGLLAVLAVMICDRLLPRRYSCLQLWGRVLYRPRFYLYFHLILANPS